MARQDDGEQGRVGWDGRHSPAAATPLRQRTSTQALPTVFSSAARKWRVSERGMHTATHARLNNLTAW
jgi:hypothetical protein